MGALDDSRPPAICGYHDVVLARRIRAEHKTGRRPGSVLDVGLVYGAGDPLILCLMATQLANNGEGAVILGKAAAIIYTAGKEKCV